MISIVLMVIPDALVAIPMVLMAISDALVAIPMVLMAIPDALVAIPMVQSVKNTTRASKFDALVMTFMQLLLT
ncbi:hypothetical protein FC756_06610 [Lysinibacillus mangiferihumi]|uniref:Uncharacterized protein n=1 Tax=Lysinibacillus mangiferihumi TaxID=1130819 RepID=A0A4U2ZAU3_9BACI|nr:hypothetical protein [Lysinibacillus mangiferihumi]TKI70762.1 hypothetical protein FC756_06610 [Lysinibacillus mangiferihumi]